MSIAIHHGPPGSYKTFALVQRHAIDALKKGRTIVTNIRGFEDVELIKSLYDIHKDASVISVDTKSKDGLLLLAKWFHWVPFGALILIDEAQAVYPMRRDFKPESLDHFTNDYGLEIEQAYNNEPRPRDMHLAFDMHRHFGWDLFLSTPNISKINKIIRQSTEWAYKHRDLSGLLPWYKNKWVEVQHDPESTGKTISSRVGVPVKYKADLKIFKCYSSTATGDYKGSEAGRSVFKDPKILGICFVVFLSIFVFFYLLLTSSSSIASGFVDEELNTEIIENNNQVPVLQTNDFIASDVININNNKNDTLNYPPAARSVSEHSAEGDNLLYKYNISGLSLKDLIDLPSSCSLSSSRSVSCSVSSDKVKKYRNTYCSDLDCFAIFSVKNEQAQQQRQGVDSYDGYKPLSFI